MSKLVALLPMKAHSSRVEGKNFRDLAGKPLFRWILDTLLAIKEIDSIIINTDALEVLREKGLPDSEKIIVRERKNALCGDEVSMNLILADDIASKEADAYLMTHTTNPLLSADTIRSAINLYQNQLDENDSLFSVNRFQTRFYGESGEPINHDPENLIPTQDLDPWFEENSCLYLFSSDSFMKTNARIGANPTMLETPKLESVDIDEPEDWMLAEALAEQFLASKQKVVQE